MNAEQIVLMREMLKVLKKPNRFRDLIIFLVFPEVIEICGICEKICLLNKPPL